MKLKRHIILKKVLNHPEKSGWCYGLVDINKKLVLCEIYSINKKFSILPIGNDDVLIDDIDLSIIIKDITAQLSYKHKISWIKDKKLLWDKLK